MELDDLTALVQAEGNETLLASIPPGMLAAAYIAIDVSRRCPTEADLREIAATRLRP